ncbi:MAG: hydrogenase nickel incorporation protein HypB [Nitrospiraceae bacterium]|nr:hydrogenase nickel incorporation protein HypB [Nitrospiraceae bacterium]MDA8090341.1 hydrogenase nickel incorporation protein HypB [Nitrospiraceae bacterium]
MKVNIVTRILEANERLAEQNRALFRENGLFVLNVMSSPGAGKTTFIEATIKALGASGLRVGVIEGDIQGTADAERIGALGVPVVQINTGGACHLDANMVRQALPDLPLAEIGLLIIENVGNLVCPAEFNVGEDAKVMLLSIAEGDDKPLKYPLMFQESRALIINKMDLLPYLDVDMGKIRRDSLSLNPSIDIFEVSARRGEGIDAWVEWLAGHIGKNS